MSDPAELSARSALVQAGEMPRRLASVGFLYEMDTSDAAVEHIPAKLNESLGKGLFGIELGARASEGGDVCRRRIARQPTWPRWCRKGDFTRCRHARRETTGNQHNRNER